MRKSVAALAVLGVLVLAAGAAGCGSTKYVTQTQTETQTTTETSTTTVNHAKVRVVHAPAPPAQTVTVTASASSSGNGGSGSGGYASTYPSTFEEGFVTECVQTSGGNSSGCSCALKNVEQSVPYSTVIAAEHDIAIGNPPSWYTDAENTCIG
jgi:hypothetical protein